ncbi:hypothetical protein MH117_15645 [Paenibacillus sp. ACRRX]|uniref:hypothetical protein n=1 Tax=Paenibacillus sp. ACRRX TaxID=2918206 RepID=UPI001EF51D61|nr:hypothetical protein [Paenibacillus sp. ACRRX]MCG7408856.1 hypothetical protein [Paenibacillus sp. ACRRX]
MHRTRKSLIEQYQVGYRQHQAEELVRQRGIEGCRYATSAADGLLSFRMYEQLTPVVRSFR